MKKTVKLGKVWLLAAMLLVTVMLLPGRAEAAQEDKVWVIYGFDADDDLQTGGGAYVVSTGSDYSVYADIDVYSDSVSYYLLYNLTDGSQYYLEVYGGSTDLGFFILNFTDDTPYSGSDFVTRDAPEENETAYLIMLAYDGEVVAGYSFETSIVSATADEDGYMYLGVSDVDFDEESIETAFFPWALVNSDGEILGIATSEGNVFSLVMDFDEFGSESSNNGDDEDETSSSSAASRDPDTDDGDDGNDTEDDSSASSDIEDNEYTSTHEEEPTTSSDETGTTTGADSDDDPGFLSQYWWALVLGGIAVVLVILIIVLVTLSKKNSAGASGQTGAAAGPAGSSGNGGASVGAAMGGNAPTAPVNNYGGNGNPYVTPVQPVSPVNTTVTAPVTPQPTSVAPQPMQHRATSLAGFKGVMQGRVYQIPAEGITIGRDPSNVIVYPADTHGVSRKHCRLFFDNAGELTLIDCGSSYGTVLVGRGKLPPQQPVKVKVGDRFYIGSENNGFEIR